jgi:hypothetical protein
MSLIIKEKCNSYVNGYAIFDNKLDYYYYYYYYIFKKLEMLSMERENRQLKRE